MLENQEDERDERESADMVDAWWMAASAQTGALAKTPRIYRIYPDDNLLFTKQQITFELCVTGFSREDRLPDLRSYQHHLLVWVNH